MLVVLADWPSGKGIKTVAFDIDPAAVEKNYLDVISNGEKTSSR